MILTHEQTRMKKITKKNSQMNCDFRLARFTSLAYVSKE